MVEYATTIQQDGLILLWTLLTKHHGTAAQISCYEIFKIDSFKDKSKYAGGDIVKFCGHVRRTMESLKSAGWIDTQAFDKIYEVARCLGKSSGLE